MFDKINDLLKERVMPALESHGGGVELIKVEDNKVYVKLSGGCQGCPGARMTIKNGVERIIKESFPEITEVVDTTNHR